jgi:PAS domain S-box-containing protein
VEKKYILNPWAWLAYSGRGLLFGLLLAGLAYLSKLAAPHSLGFVSFVFPSGVAAAAYYLTGKKHWPYMIAGQLAAIVAFHMLNGYPLYLSLCFSAAYAAEAVVGASFALRFSRGEGPFIDFASFLYYAAFAALLGPALGAGIGTLGVSSAPGAANPFIVWLTWFSGDCMSVLFLAIPVIAWSKPLEDSSLRLGWKRGLELCALVTALAMAVWVGFVKVGDINPAARYMVLPVLLWAGFRFPLRIVSLVDAAFVVLIFVSLQLPFPGSAGVPEMSAIALLFSAFTMCCGLLPCAALMGLRSANSSVMRSESETKRLLTLYQDLVETSQDLLLQCDSGGRFVYLNPAWERVMGYSQSEMLGRKYYDFIEPASVQEAKDMVRTLLSKGPIMGSEQVFMSKDGRQIRLMFNLKATLDAEGRISEARGTAYDMTERRRLDEAMQIAHRLESLGVLAGGIAHDFNNLLGGIYGFIDLAIHEGDIDKVHEYLRKTLGPYNRARDLTRQLLTFAKGGAPVKRKASLAEVLTESVEFSLSGRKVVAEFGDMSAIPVFPFDANQIAQVFQNIAINACDAMPEGGRIRVEAGLAKIGPGESSTLSTGNYVRIRITDSGPGIPAEILPRVFDPFFSTKKKGSGLGLAICYSVVSKHGGTIDVESQAGKGATFNIMLPLLDYEEKEGFTGTTAPTGGSADFKGHGRALVMDNEEYMREVGAGILANLGFETLGASDGDAALTAVVSAFAEKKPISLALLDLTVPGKRGGVETARELRRACDQGIALIAVSGYVNDPIFADPGSFGFDGAVSKPYRLADISAMLAKLNLPDSV